MTFYYAISNRDLNESMNFLPSKKSKKQLTDKVYRRENEFVMSGFKQWQSVMIVMTYNKPPQ